MVQKIMSRPPVQPTVAKAIVAPKAEIPAPVPNSGATPLAGSGLMVSFRNVTKVYENGSRGLLDINLDIKQGDFLFITGPSGAGKSTLLKLLYGEEKATQGEVIVDGCNLQDIKGDRLSLLRRRIGIVFQDYKLIPRRTVAENVAFVLQAQGYPRKEIYRRLQPTLQTVGLKDKANCFPDQLSGGEQQRVSIARAIVSTPPLLLADEPTGNLDFDNAWQVIKILKKLNKIGITVIVTTHNEQIVEMSNRPVIRLCDGKLVKVRR